MTVAQCFMWNDFRSPAFAATVLFAVLSTSATKAENWPGWRGPSRTGVTSDTGVPDEWSASDNVLWKTPLEGLGTSNPVVWDDRVFLTASLGRDQGELHVLCIDRDTGKTLWKQKLWGTAPTLFYTVSGMASPSPVTDGTHLFAFFGTGDVFCFDLDGQMIWQRSLADEYGPFENRFGASSSPLVFEDTVILQCDHYGESYVIALEKETGANRWKADRAGNWLSWSSPQLIQAGETQELIVSGSERLDGYDPKTGDHLWTVRGQARECVPTPVVGDGFLISVSGPNGTHFAVKPGGRGDVTESHVLWKNERGTSFVPSAILVGQRYYVADDKGVATCFDAEAGKLLWRKRLEGRFTASPVSAEGKVYFTSESGQTMVIDAAKEDYDELARNELGESVYASPAISQGRLYFRTPQHLICVGYR